MKLNFLFNNYTIEIGVIIPNSNLDEIVFSITGKEIYVTTWFLLSENSYQVEHEEFLLFEGVFGYLMGCL